jgi:isopentenyl-diphosphate Delta-isomerase
MDKEENVDLLDTKGNKTGRIVKKGEAHRNALWHTGAHVWIYNSNGEVLLQKRSMEKENYPGLWDISAAGHVSAGEKPKDAALRELNEELGIRTDPKNLKKILVFKSSSDYSGSYHNREFEYVYILKIPVNSKVIRQKEEVDATKFIPVKKFKTELNNPRTAKMYVPHKYYFKLIDAVNKELDL